METIQKERKINRLPLPSVIKHTSLEHHKGNKFVVYEGFSPYTALSVKKKNSIEKSVNAFPILN